MGQGHGFPEPPEKGNGRVGSSRPLTSYHSLSVVTNKATGPITTVTNEESNPQSIPPSNLETTDSFARRSLVEWTPPKQRASSLPRARPRRNSPTMKPISDFSPQSPNKEMLWDALQHANTNATIAKLVDSMNMLRKEIKDLKNLP